MRRCLFVAATLSFAGEALAVDVLLVHQSGYISDVEAKLLASGAFTSVDVWNAGAATPDVATMQGYDVVFTVADGGWDVAAMGDNLADYVDGGGGVVQDIFAWTQQLGGRWQTDGYPALTATSAYSSPEALAGVIPHPITAGFNVFTSSLFHSQSTTLAPGATELAYYASGYPVVAVASRGAGTVVTINEYSPSSDIRADFWDSSTDGVALLANSLLFAANAAPAGLRTGAQGTCGGAATIRTFDATPNGTLVYASGNPNGTATIPGGPCAGRSLPIGNPRLRATRRANNNGADTISIPTFGPGACGATYVVVDLATCAVARGQMP